MEVQNQRKMDGLPEKKHMRMGKHRSKQDELYYIAQFFMGYELIDSYYLYTRDRAVSPKCMHCDGFRDDASYPSFQS